MPSSATMTLIASAGRRKTFASSDGAPTQLQCSSGAVARACFSVNDESGRLLRRYRRLPDRREIIIIDNRYSGPPMPFGYFIDLPPPVIRIPREHYIVDAEYAQPDDIYDALWAAPVDFSSAALYAR